MSGRHVIASLSAYHHGELHAAKREGVAAHLRTCPKCRAADDEIRFGARLASMLSVTRAPESLWNGFQAMPRVPVRRRWLPQFAFAGVVAMVVVALLIFLRNPAADTPQGPAWEVTGLPGTEELRPGEVLRTGESSEAEVKIANIGELTVEPNTTIRLLVTQSSEHRIALDRGKVEANTWAPPRLFIVETPAATAVDLGCRYTLEVEADGGSLLHVSLGLVALERDGRETIVPAGAFCRTRAATGPGIPFYEDSTSEFQAAIAALETSTEESERGRQLKIVLRESRIRDVLSLWHMLPRLDDQSRGLIYDRMSQLMPPPPEVTRDGIIALDPKMFDAWRKTVSQLWQ